MMEERLDFIPCLTFVKRGVAKARPEKIKPTKEELQEIMKEMKLKEAEYQGRPEAEQDVQMKGEDSDSDAAVDEYYNMDNYDDEPTDTATSIPIENLILQNADDSDDDDDEDEDTDDEPDEFTIQPTDNPILVGHVEDDACMLEVYVFNNDRAELFILHDIFLPSYPLSIEWLNFDPKNSENPAHFAAVGNMSNKIDIWDLNVTGCLEPAYSLGGKKAKGVKHKDAVITLAWNESTRNVLASGSADNTVILWNLADQKALTKLSVFEEKVQSIKWHPVENHNLLTGSCEGKVRLFDCRSTSTFKTWIFDGEIEKIMWNKLDPTYYFATTNTGMVHYVDIRNPKPVWNLKAHDKEVTGIALSSHCPDLLVTGSMDETVKVWDLKDQIPHHVANKNMNIGSIYTLESCMDVPYVFCAGGSKKDNNLYLWDVRESDPVMERFKDRRLEELARPDSSSGTMNESGPSSSSSSSALRQFGNADGRIRKTKNRSAIESVNSESTGSGAEAGDDARPKKGKKSSSKS